MAFASAVVLTPIQLVARSAVSIASLTAADATHGNRFACNKRTQFRVKNASGAPITVTVNVTALRNGLALADATFSVPATTGDVIWTGFDSVFEQDDTGHAHITYSGVTSLTVQVIQP
jgi:hypothetical protein